MLSLLQIRLGDENSGPPALKFHQPDTPSLTQAFAGPGAASGDGWHVTVPSEWRGAGEAQGRREAAIEGRAVEREEITGLKGAEAAAEVLTRARPLP